MLKEQKTQGKFVDIRNIHIASHPVRYAILDKIYNYGDKGCYPTKIAEEIKENRELVSFHLIKLENVGIVEGEYGLKDTESKPPRAVIYYKLTKKGKIVFDKINKINY